MGENPSITRRAPVDGAGVLHGLDAADVRDDAREADHAGAVNGVVDGFSPGEQRTLNPVKLLGIMVLVADEWRCPQPRRDCSMMMKGWLTLLSQIEKTWDRPSSSGGGWPDVGRSGCRGKEVG
jgi:hypothetical protein